MRDLQIMLKEPTEEVVRVANRKYDGVISKWNGQGQYCVTALRQSSCCSQTLVCASKQESSGSKRAFQCSLMTYVYKYHDIHEYTLLEQSAPGSGKLNTNNHVHAITWKDKGRSEAAAFGSLAVTLMTS